MTTAARLAALAAAAGFGATCFADFVPPTEFGWSREDTGTVYFAWDVFSSAAGPNSPDVGQFPVTLPGGWESPNVFDTSGTSFLTGGGNIYSPVGPLSLRVVLPVDDSSAEGAATTLIVQVKTQGTEVSPESVRVGDAAPAEVRELSRLPFGGMGFIVETLYRFELTGAGPTVTVRLDGSAAHMSLDRVTVDAWTRADDTCPADHDGDGFVTGLDFDAYVADFEAGIGAADFDGDGFVTGLDFDAYVSAFETGC